VVKPKSRLRIVPLGRLELGLDEVLADIFTRSLSLDLVSKSTGCSAVYMLSLLSFELSCAKKVAKVTGSIGSLLIIIIQYALQYNNN